jgi:hypothetical protein
MLVAISRRASVASGTRVTSSIDVVVSANAATPSSNPSPSADWARASERLERCGYDDDGEALWRRTLTLVRAHNDLINWVAQHLAYAQTLDGRAIDDIVRRG